MVNRRPGAAHEPGLDGGSARAPLAASTGVESLSPERGYLVPQAKPDPLELLHVLLPVRRLAIVDRAIEPPMALEELFEISLHTVLLQIAEEEYGSNGE